MFDFLLKAILGVGVEYLLKDVESPPDPSKTTINETDPESVLYAAAMIDYAGE